MKKAEIRVGGHYIVKISGRLTTARVDYIAEKYDHNDKLTVRYDVTNLATGRKTSFRSAAKFRSEVETPKCKHSQPIGGKCDTCLTGEAEQHFSEVEELARPEATADRLLREERRSDPPSVIGRIFTAGAILEDEQRPDPTPRIRSGWRRVGEWGEGKALPERTRIT